ncbi:MAG: DNA repair protein RadA, partial [Acidobacteriota bacterium]
MDKKERTIYICQSCGYQSPKWLGRCPECRNWHSLVEEREKGSPVGEQWAPFLGEEAIPRLYQEVEDKELRRLGTGMDEFDRVLGGGIVPGSLVLIGGEPGIGKSTLLLQTAEKLSLQGEVVLYISGEESESQIRLRGERLKLRPDKLYFLAETCLERIFEQTERLRPTAIIVDSIQTVFSLRFQSAPGSISQVREGALQLLFFGKSRKIPIFIIGHVTKEGYIAGPRTMEHIVDTVLYFEGERHQAHRILRAVKNRFGPANELGIFEMGTRGLRPVPNPSQVLLAERSINVPGSVVISCMEGTRPLLVEVQALVSSSSYANPRRVTIGIDYNKVSLLIAVLEKRMGLKLMGNDIYVNLAGGVSVLEPATDLGVAIAIASSFKNKA